jgi:hypothetical protein
MFVVKLLDMITTAYPARSKQLHNRLVLNQKKAGPMKLPAHANTRRFHDENVPHLRDLIQMIRKECDLQKTAKDSRY